MRICESSIDASFKLGSNLVTLCSKLNALRLHCAVVPNLTHSQAKWHQFAERLRITIDSCSSDSPEGAARLKQLRLGTIYRGVPSTDSSVLQSTRVRVLASELLQLGFSGVTKAALTTIRDSRIKLVHRL